MAEGAASGWETFRDESFDEVPLLIEPLPPPPLARDVEEIGSLEELLDQGESLLQEYRSGSKTLVDRICIPENVSTLVGYATQQPPEGIAPDQARLRSHTAAELLSLCSPGAEGAQDEPCKLLLSQAFFAVNGASPNPLEILWNFLLDAQLDPKKPSWTVLAGYFCHIASALYHRCPDQVLEYLRHRGPDQVLESFLRFLDTRCIAELFATLLCTPDAERGLFEVDGLVLRLVECLSGASATCEDTSENVSLVLKTLLCQACLKKLYYASTIIEQMSSAVVVERLVRKMCVESADLASAAKAAASVLVGAVSQLLHTAPNPALASKGPNLLRPFEEEEGHPQETEVDDALRSAGAALVRQLCQHLPDICGVFLGPASQEDGDGGALLSDEQHALDLQRLREATVLLLEAAESDLCTEDLWNQLLQLATGSKLLEDTLSAHLALRDGSESSEVWKKSQLIADLRRARAAHEAETSTLCQTARRSRKVTDGPAAIEAMSLMVELARLQDVEVLQVFVEQRVLSRGLRRLLSRPWGAVMLNSVTALCTEVIRSPELQGKEAAEGLLEEDHLLDQVAAVLRKQSEVREALSQRHDNKGELSVPQLAAPLRKICVELREAGSRWPEVHMCLFTLDAWTEVILPDLEEFTQLEEEPLGGFDKLASVGSVAIPGEVEFSPEDLRDIDEDFDTECLLSLAGEQMLQRQARVAAQKAGGTDAETPQEVATEEPGSNVEEEPAPIPAERAPGDTEWV